LLEEFERKQRLERELKMQQRQANMQENDLIFKSGGDRQKKPVLFDSQTPE
jgi:hypothetical protein